MRMILCSFIIILIMLAALPGGGGITGPLPAEEERKQEPTREGGTGVGSSSDGSSIGERPGGEHSLERDREIFITCLQEGGPWQAAARIGRSRPEEFLRILKGFSAKSGEEEAPGILMVEGDLLLARGKRDEALSCYRKAASKLEPHQPWLKSSPQSPPPMQPRGAETVIVTDYFVDPPLYVPETLKIEPYTVGPGSHRDNWLIKRFIALRAWDDAEREFERLWTVHVLLSRPYVLREPPRARSVPGLREPSGTASSPATASAPWQRHFVRSRGFYSPGLRFCLDYAYFLMKRQQKEKALAVLMEPFREMDLDKNPNLVSKEKVPAGSYPELPLFTGDAIASRYFQGISRREFIRLAYGELKDSGCEAQLVELLEKQISGGQNRARRILARVRLHQGRMQDALLEELEYIKMGGFDELTKSYRKGIVCEEMQKPSVAVKEYEHVLALPYHPPAIPDKDEEQIQNELMSSVRITSPDPATKPGHEAFQRDLLARLQHLYTALGMEDRALDASLRQLAASPSQISDPQVLENVGRRFEASGKKALFSQWMKHQLTGAKDPPIRASLCWAIDDYRGAAEAAGRCTSRNHRMFWEQRLQQKGKEPHIIFCRSRLAQNSDDAATRLTLLDLEDRWKPSEVIPAMEAFLAYDEFSLLIRGDDALGRAQFRNRHDCAYRLMRLYEQTGQIAKLKELGLRIARAEKPFDFRQFDPSQYRYRDKNGLIEDLSACLSLLIQHADDSPTQQALKESLRGKPYPWSAALEQLSRRTGRDSASREPAPFGWANAPRGAVLLASNEDVLSLAADDRYVYAGMPWGIAVYTHRAEPVTRIAMDADAQGALVRDGTLWVASSRGLYRIAIGTWKIARMELEGDVPGESPMTDWRSARNAVKLLALDGDSLWISAHRRIQRYDADSGKLHVYDPEELGATDDADWHRLLVEREYLWADGTEGCRRLDRKSGRWDRVFWGEREVSLIGVVDGTRWGHVYINDELRDRPCIIDRTSLKVTPVLIEDGEGYDRCFNGPWSYYGKWRGNAVFGDGYPSYYYDAQIKKLRHIPFPHDGSRLTPAIESAVPGGLLSGAQWRQTDGTVMCDDHTTSWHELAPGYFVSTMNWVMKKLPGGATVIGARTVNVSPDEAWNDDSEIRDEEGGLYFLYPGRKIERASSQKRSDVIAADAVRDLFFDAGGSSYICTSRGIAALDEGRGVQEIFTRAGGLGGNRVTAGTPLQGKVYFASGWGDSGGGLLVYDPATGVFTSLGRSDGMDGDKLESLSAADGRLILTYGAEYLRFHSKGDLQYRVCAPGAYDPVTATFTSGGAPQFVTAGQAFKSLRGRTLGPMPCLGGFILKRIEHGAKIYLCGTRGLLIQDKGKSPQIAIARIAPSAIENSPASLKAEALKVKIAESPSPEELQPLLRHRNPWIRVRAIETAGRMIDHGAAGFASLAGSMIGDPFRRARLMAVHCLSRSNDPEAIEPLRRAVKDSDPYARAIAILALARKGVFLPLSCYEEVLTHSDSYGNLPHGIKSSIGVVVDHDEVYSLLAPRADLEVFRLFLKHPPPDDCGSDGKKMMADLGAALRKHPDAAELLLQVKDSHNGDLQFATEVFRYAGKDMLPLLHKALQSPDRVVRSNAALACGSIKERSSIPCLITALDLESGLARASIVWALGELRAGEGLSALKKLYVDARNDEKRHSGSGFRSGQMRAALNSEYESLSNLDAIGSEWDELKESLTPGPLEPSWDEKLLEPRDILKAIEKIGPGASQEFYRALAGDRDERARNEGAIGLAEGTGEDRAKNLPVLRGLLGDENVGIRMNAAVSMLITGQEQTKSMILQWLDSPVRWEKRCILGILIRVKDPSKLDFAGERIEAIANDISEEEEVRKAARSLLREKEK